MYRNDKILSCIDKILTLLGTSKKLHLTNFQSLYTFEKLEVLLNTVQYAALFDYNCHAFKQVILPWHSFSLRISQTINNCINTAHCVFSNTNCIVLLLCEYSLLSFLKYFQGKCHTLMRLKWPHHSFKKWQTVIFAGKKHWNWRYFE